jgi:hypothetical protein
MKSLSVFGSISFGRKVISPFNFFLRKNIKMSNIKSFTLKRTERASSPLTAQTERGGSFFSIFESSFQPLSVWAVRGEQPNTHYI